MTATAFAGAGFIAFAPGAFAATVSYDCTPSAIQDPFSTDVSYTIDAPAEAEPGETIDFRVNGAATTVPTSPLNLGSGNVSRTIPVSVYQNGDLVGSFDTTATNSAAIPAGGEIATDPPAGSFTAPETEGTLTFEIGDFTTVVSSLVTVTTTCVTDTPGAVHTTAVGTGGQGPGDPEDPEEPGDPEDSEEPGDPGDPGDPEDVTTPGRTESTGLYQCVSSNTDLLEDFETAATVVLSTDGDTFPVDTEIEVAGKVELAEGPVPPIDLEPGAVSATLSVGLSGDAAPAEGVDVFTRNTETLPGGAPISSLPAGTGSFTAQTAGAVDLSAGDLSMSIFEGLVTLDCSYEEAAAPPDDSVPPGDGGDGGGQDGDGGPADDKAPPAADDQLPVTGGTLGGLLAAALAALGLGAGTLFLARRRRAATAADVG